MTRIVLVMHDPLASALASCARHILGQEPVLDVFDIVATDMPDKRLVEIVDTLTATPGVPTLVLCDIFGASPFNAARKAMELARSDGFEVEVMAGANLCMVLKALTAPRDEFRAFLRAVRAAATRGIVCAGDPS